MAFDVGSITGTIDLKRAPAIDALKAVKKEAVSDFKPGMEGAFKDAELAGKKAAEGVGKSWKESLHGLKSEFGRGSVFSHTLELAAGGGVIMGVGIALERVKALSAGVVELKNTLNEGGNAGAAWMKLGEALPLVGELASTFGNLNEVMLGNAASAKKAEEDTRLEIERTNDAWDHRKKILQDGARATEEWGKKQIDLAYKLAEAFSGPKGKDLLSRGKALGAELSGADAGYVKAKGEIQGHQNEAYWDEVNSFLETPKGEEALIGRLQKLGPAEAQKRLAEIIAKLPSTHVKSYGVTGVSGAGLTYGDTSYDVENARKKPLQAYLDAMKFTAGRMDNSAFDAQRQDAAGRALGEKAVDRIAAMVNLGKTLGGEWFKGLAEGFKKSSTAAQKQTKEETAEWTKDQAAAKSLTDAARTPFQKFADEIYEAVGLKAKGMLTGAQAGQIAKHSFEQFTGGNAFDARLPEAMKAGSYAEFQNTFLNRAEQANAQQKSPAEEALIQAVTTNTSKLDELVTAIRSAFGINGNGTGVVDPAGTTPGWAH